MAKYAHFYYKKYKVAQFTCAYSLNIDWIRKHCRADVKQQSSRPKLSNISIHAQAIWAHVSLSSTNAALTFTKARVSERELETERLRDRWVWDFQHAWPWAAMWQTPCPWPLLRLEHSKALRETERDRPWISTHLFTFPTLPLFLLHLRVYGCFWSEILPMSARPSLALSLLSGTGDVCMCV